MDQQNKIGIKERLSLAAIHLKGANMGLAAKSLFGSSLNHWEYRNGDDYFYPIDNDYSFRHYNGLGLCDYENAYYECPPLSAVINYKASQYINGKTWVLTANGKSKEEESNSPYANKLRKLLREPNRFQTWEEFEAQNYIYTQLFGFSIVLIQKPVGFDNIDAEALWNINPAWCEINEQQGIFYSGDNKGIESIYMTYGGVSTQLPLDKVYVIRDLTASFRSIALPDGRVRSLAMPINNIIGAYESRNMLINSRGALGMLTNQTQDSASHIKLKPDEKEGLHSDFKQLYGLKKGQSHVIITSANLKWQPMVLPTKDLMLFEEIVDDTNRICHAYQFPPELLAQDSKGTTYSNMQTATRNLYQGAIIPEAKNIYAQWNKIFETYKYNLVLDRDYSEIDALQPDALAEANARLRRNQAYQIEYRNNICKGNDWRIANGEDPRTECDVYYSDIKHLLDENPVNIEDMQVEDNINPREGNDGTPGQQA